MICFNIFGKKFFSSKFLKQYLSFLMPYNNFEINKSFKIYNYDKNVLYLLVQKFLQLIFWENGESNVKICIFQHLVAPWISKEGNIATKSFSLLFNCTYYYRVVYLKKKKFWIFCSAIPICLKTYTLSIKIEVRWKIQKQHVFF